MTGQLPHWQKYFINLNAKLKNYKVMITLKKIISTIFCEKICYKEKKEKNFERKNYFYPCFRKVSYGKRTKYIRNFVQQR